MTPNLITQQWLQEGWWDNIKFTHDLNEIMEDGRLVPNMKEEQHEKCRDIYNINN